MSKGEERISQILKQSHIKFDTEVSVPNLRGKRGAPLRYDFALYSKGKLALLIEFDGEQHFHYSPFFHKKKSDFNYRRGCDRKKNEWALEHGVPLCRIPYWELDNLNNFFDLVKSDFKVSSIYHNDRIIRDKFGG